MTKIDPTFKDKIKKYGAFDLTACYNCGHCTAVCSLSSEKDSFPREMVRFSMLGLQNDIKTSLKPWLCYYCGECSETCPRQANPGELMMSLRRWLTAKYDWTGLSGIFYRSLGAMIFAFLIIIAAVIAFAAKMNFNVDKIMLYGHYFEIIAISAVATIILLPNIIRMYYFSMIKNGIKVKLSDYFKHLDALFVHMFTQKRANECDDNSTRWLLHLILVIAYLSLLLTTVLLNWFETSSLFVIWLGYIESAAIFIITAVFIFWRVNKNNETAKHSQPSDWFFVIWLFFMGISAFAVRLFVDLNIIDNNLWLYLVHLIILVQWALIIVPFGKWTHFLYRSFAMYFDELKKNSTK
jgi:quinone-modifying oxidoreductase subunit QmoC